MTREREPRPRQFSNSTTAAQGNASEEAPIGNTQSRTADSTARRKRQKDTPSKRSELPYDREHRDTLPSERQKTRIACKGTTSDPRPTEVPMCNNHRHTRTSFPESHDARSDLPCAPRQRSPRKLHCTLGGE